MKKVNSRYIKNLIISERNNLKEELRMYAAVLREANRMHSDGLKRETINENIIDLLRGLISPLLDPAMQTFKNKMMMFMLSRLGINPQGKFASIVRNTLEEIHVDDLGDVLGGERCDEFVRHLSRGLVEAMATEPLFDSIAESFGINKGGALYMTLRESFQNKLNEEIFQNEVSDAIFKEVEGIVCTIEYRDVLGGFFSKFKENISDIPSMSDVGDVISQKLGGEESV